IGVASAAAPAVVTAMTAATRAPSRAMARIRLGTAHILPRQAASCCSGTPLASVDVMSTTPESGRVQRPTAQTERLPETPTGIRGHPGVAVGMVLGSISSVQFGAALATTLFGRIGPAGTVFLRGAFGGLVLLAVAHRDVRRLRRGELRDVALFGVTL